jgi:hypothetical protein
MFDTEKYMQLLESRSILASETLKMPQYKVPSNNLVKLSFDKKLVNIILDVKIQDPNGSSKFFLLRDRFDWDIGDSDMRPLDFATDLVNSLEIYPDQATRDETIKRVEESILS